MSALSHLQLVIMVKKINGLEISEKIKDEIAAGVFLDPENRPNLAIIMVGERPDSKMYVSLKQREGLKVGIDTHLYFLEETVTQPELIEVIKFLNSDSSIDGILIQLPLPDFLNTDQIIAAIDPEKDVDGFHPNHPKFLTSPVLASVGACLDYIGFVGQGKKACVLYNSEVFGRSARDYLSAKGLMVLPPNKSAEADLLLSALGKPRTIKAEMIKEGAILIDVGITSLSGRAVGDLDWESVAGKADWATPVPGGIGPLTVAFLLKNTWEIHKRKNKS